jgi:hypothetical protein
MCRATRARHVRFGTGVQMTLVMLRIVLLGLYSSSAGEAL